MAYFLVRIETEPDRDEETAEWIARHLSVSFHAEVGARPWSPGQWEGESQRPGDEYPNYWHRRDYKGDPIMPEEAKDG